MLNAIKEDKVRKLMMHNWKSTTMYLLCKYIKKNTDITVMFSGEVVTKHPEAIWLHNARIKIHLIMNVSDY